MGTAGAGTWHLSQFRVSSSLCSDANSTSARPNDRSVVNPNAVLFHDPEQPAECLLRKQAQHAPDCSLNGGMRLTAEPQNNDPRKPGGWVGMNIREIQIEGDERSTLTRTNVDHALIWVTTKRLLHYGVCFMPGGNKQVRECGRKVLVELEFHAVLVSTTRSRANSAAYDMAAATSSRFSVG